eukprot:TRINITY_DN6299_c0_g4_i1.p1 TRINITY_DN6299_c0_g4~~TRINITY_DN6299_c0_g4_i1.p1  ORF type:complete len:296 (+),score=62.77 TRINITY_DN6299_c0_g4_i1:48-890(+)
MCIRDSPKTPKIGHFGFELSGIKRIARNTLMLLREIRRFSLHAALRSFGSSLITHKESRLLPFSTTHLYSVIHDVHKYDEFLPFCKKGRVISEETKGDCTKLVAEITVGFMGIGVKYLSDAYCKPDFIHIVKNANDDMFKELDTQWLMQELPNAKTKLDFSIRFELNNYLYNNMVSLFKSMLVNKMNSAFIERARKLSGLEQVDHEIEHSASNARVLENLHYLLQANKLKQEEYKHLVEMITNGVNMQELQTIDQAYGGSEELKDMYAGTLKKLLVQIHK